MSTRSSPRSAATYQITVKGYLGDEWAAYFDFLEVEHRVKPDGAALTCLTGRLVDQAALHGTLQNLYGLGLELVSFQIVPGDEGLIE